MAYAFERSIGRTKTGGTGVTNSYALSDAGRSVFRHQCKDSIDDQGNCWTKIRRPRLCLILIAIFLGFTGPTCFAIICLWVRTAQGTTEEVVHVHDRIRNSFEAASNVAIDGVLNQLVLEDMTMEMLAVSEYINMPLLAVEMLAGAVDQSLITFDGIDANVKELWWLQRTLPSLEKKFAWGNIPKLQNIFYADKSGMYQSYSNDCSDPSINCSDSTTGGWVYSYSFRPRASPENETATVCSTMCPVNPIEANRSIYSVDKSSGKPQILNSTYSYDPRKRPWWQTAMNASGEVAWSNIHAITRERNNETWYGFSVVRGSSLNGNRGIVVGSTLTVEHITKILLSRVTLAAKRRAPDNESCIFIVDEKGGMIASSSGLSAVLCGGPNCTDRQLRWNDLDNSLIKAAVASVLTRFPGGLLNVSDAGLYMNETDGYIFSHHRISSGSSKFGLRWIIIRAQPIAAYKEQIWKMAQKSAESGLRAKENLKEHLDAQEQFTVLMCGLFLVIGSIGLSFLSWFVTRRLKNIATEMNKVANFEFDVQEDLLESGKSSRTLDAHRVALCHDPRNIIHEVAEMERSFDNMKNGLQSFSRYMDPNIVQILVQSGKKARLAVAPANVTVFFSDIANFTTMAESLQPCVLAGMLGEYLEEMSSIIMRNNGIVGEFIGDEIMAWWNAPWDLGSMHTVLALNSALEQQNQIRMLNQKWATKGLREVRARMGIVCGQVLAGNIGSQSRMKYGLVGDNVNLASRLEQLCKRYGVDIIIDGKTCDAEGVRESFFVRPIDLVTVKGRAEPTELFQLVARKDQLEESPTEESQTHFCDAFATAHRLYRNRDFLGTLAAIDEYQKHWPDDTPSQILKNRCMMHLHSEPGASWSPIEHLSEK